MACCRQNLFEAMQEQIANYKSQKLKEGQSIDSKEATFQWLQQHGTRFRDDWKEKLTELANKGVDNGQQ